MKKLTTAQWVAMSVFTLIVCSALIFQAVTTSFTWKFIAISTIIMTATAYHVFGIFRGIVEALND